MDHWWPQSMMVAAPSEAGAAQGETVGQAGWSAGHSGSCVGAQGLHAEHTAYMCSPQQSLRAGNIPDLP